MKILVSALEHSANIHLKALIQELDSDTELIGIFDKRLGTPIIDLSDIAIMGFVDALKKLPFFLKLNKQMLNLAKDVDKVLLIDSSGFNLPLAKKIKKQFPEKEIIYYILPQAWAWKKKRIPVLEQTIDVLASILPFEQNYYSKNAPIQYVGHPLLDEIKLYKEAPTHSNKIVFMPGSRPSEIKRMMPIFQELQHKLKEEIILVIPSHFSKADINKLYGNITCFKTTNNAHEALYEADFAFICSGTATLEAALIGIPFVLGYKAKTLDYFIAKNLVKLKYVGLSNNMFMQYKNEPLHPEFLQEEMTAENLYNAYKDFDRRAFLVKSKVLRQYLQHGSAKRVATLIEETHEN